MVAIELNPPRTYASDLTDDELVLFDFLWLWGIPESMLYGSTLALHANTPYCHSIPDDQLHSRLLALVERDLLYMYLPAYPIAGPRRLKDFALTEQGLATWESERLPDWSRYLDDSWSDGLLTVASTCAEVGLRYIDTCREVWDIGTAIPTHFIETNVELVRWKTFRQVHYFEVSIAPMSPHWSTSCWSVYQANRVWWRMTSELWKPGTTSPAL